MYHTFLIHLSAGGHLGCFQIISFLRFFFLLYTHDSLCKLPVFCPPLVLSVYGYFCVSSFTFCSYLVKEPEFINLK